MLDIDDTIVAIASPTSPANRGVVRISGTETANILQRLGVDCPSVARAVRYDASLNVGMPLGTIPVSVLLWPSSRSYSGQPSAELQTYGSLPILRSLVDAVIAAGARGARPGEFTMRAFLAGRLDLTQAEAVLGVIEAEGRGTLDHALRQLAGNLARPLNRMRSAILDLLADVEAGLDFVDEDIEFISDAALINRLIEIKSQLADTSIAIATRGGGAARPVIALRGQPNAGKSSLMNRLAGKPVSIVAETAGTTRDFVSAEVAFSGCVVWLVDTAGIETTDPAATDQTTRIWERQRPHSASAQRTDDQIVADAQFQATRAADEAEIRIWCVDSSSDDALVQAQRLSGLARSVKRPGAIDVWVATKADVGQQNLDRTRWIHCSAVTGDGIDLVEGKIVETVAARDREEVGSVIGTAARCGQSVDLALEAVSNAIELTQNQDGHEFVAAELRRCADCLGEVTGAIYTDDILDRVFARFCIGK